MINTVIFDLDGTLIDTNELITDTWRHTVKTLTGSDISDDVIRGTMGEVLPDSMRRIMPGIDIEEALDVYRDFQRDRFLSSIKLYEGVEEALRAIHEAGYKNAILTSRMRTSTEKGLAFLGIADLFDAVLTANDTKIFKPDPAPVYQVLDILGARPEEAMFVGDTVHDIEAGLAAGVFTVLVDWSYALPPEKREGAPSPDAVIENMEDLLKLLYID